MLRSIAICNRVTAMPHWDLLLRDTHIATMRAGATPFGVIENAALAIADGRIAWLGTVAELPPADIVATRSLGGQWLTPALIDCHTHLVFAGNRAAEFEQRLGGASYEDIARAGGGIMSTVNATRAAGDGELTAQALERMLTLKQEGVATVEIKSGYGLDLQNELKMLRIARNLQDAAGISVQTTFLGAHAVPAEYRGRSGDYVNLICREMLPAVAEQQLADAVDAYCENIAFSNAEVGRVFETARSLGLPVKLHADQLSDCGGAELAASFKALSADHLEYSSTAGIDAMSAAATVAVLLPGAFLTLGETQLPPVAELRDAGVCIAIASDCNPGTSPICSIRAIMSLAGSLFGLTPEECLAGVTREAARALGLGDRGTLENGKRADVAVWDIGHPRELSYWMGLSGLSGLLVNGHSVAS